MRFSWLSQRRNVVVLAVIGGLLALLAVTRTWITVQPPNQGVALSPISVSGTDASAAVLALAVVGLACALATSIAGRIASLIVGAVQALAGVGVAALSIAVFADPGAAAAAKVGKSFGLERVSGQAYQVAAWPWLSVAGGAILVFSAVLVIAFSRSWHTARRFERTRSGRAVLTADTMDDIDRWDAFTDGEDPTDAGGNVKGARYH